MIRILFLYVLCSFSCFSQYDNTNINFIDYEYQQDFLVNPEDSLEKDVNHPARTAVLLSAVLPGAGQVFNHILMPKGKKKAYWKVPLIYAGLGATGYFLVTNQRTQKELKIEYTSRQDGGIGDPKWNAYDDEGVLVLYNQYQNWRDLSIIAFGAVYILQLIDAGVEAHFLSFDVSEDLTIAFEPVMMDYRTGGFRMTLNFR